MARIFGCRFLLLWFVSTLGAVAAGCGGSHWMRPAAPPQAITATPSEATVVFMRPSGYGRKARMMVVDGEGRYLGDPQGKQYFMYRFQPGHYTFVAWAENADMVEADLAAGRVYYVLLSIRMGVWTARMSLSKLTPERGEWANLQTWLTGSKQMIPDVAAAQGWVDGHRDDIANRIKTAREVFEGLAPEKRALRVIGAEEGVLVSPPPPVAGDSTAGGAVASPQPSVSAEAGSATASEPEVSGSDATSAQPAALGQAAPEPAQ